MQIMQGWSRLLTTPHGRGFKKMSSVLLQHLHTKKEVDHAIKRTEDKVLVLRFGREDETECMKLDDIVSQIVLCI